MTREQSPPVADRIRAILPEMPLALARVADYLLRNPQAPLTLSIGELAEQAGTSPAKARTTASTSATGRSPIAASTAAPIAVTAPATPAEVGLPPPDRP